MPIHVNGTSVQGLTSQLDEALEIVCNEFEGLNPHQQYRNAFSRVLKRDPLGRVAMMGTDQRDLFIPLLRQAIQSYVPQDGHVFDCGAGDGQTFARVADSVPAGTTVTIEEPNPAYVADYLAFLKRHPNLRAGVALPIGLDEFEQGTRSGGLDLPESGSVDLALGLHALGFATNLVDCMAAILTLVRPGGLFFGVVADESTSYTGIVEKAFIEGLGDADMTGSYFAGIHDRRKMLAPVGEGGGGLPAALADMGVDVEVESVRQPSRMYGHSLADLLAISNIGVLSNVTPADKFTVGAEVLRRRFEEVDLRVETEGPRAGMWSVAQPQWVVSVRRVR